MRHYISPLHFFASISTYAVHFSLAFESLKFVELLRRFPSGALFSPRSLWYVEWNFLRSSDLDHFNLLKGTRDLAGTRYYANERRDALPLIVRRLWDFSFYLDYDSTVSWKLACLGETFFQRARWYFACTLGGMRWENAINARDSSLDGIFINIVLIRYAAIRGESREKAAAAAAVARR